MRDLLLQCAGVAAIAAAIIHGVLGETKVFPRVTIEPMPRLRFLIRLCWQAGTVGVDRRWRTADRRALNGLGAGAALDRHHDVRDVRLRDDRQRLGVPRPAFWMDGAQRRYRDGGGWLLERMFALAYAASLATYNIAVALGAG